MKPVCPLVCSTWNLAVAVTWAKRPPHGHPDGQLHWLPQFLKFNAESNLKRIVLEAGGKNYAVVMNHCEDFDEGAQFAPPMRSGA